MIKEKCEHTGDWSRLNIRIYKRTLELKFNSKQKEYRQNTFTYISKICLLGKKSKIIIPILFDLLVEAHPHYLSVLIRGCIKIEFSEKKGPQKILYDCGYYCYTLVGEKVGKIFWVRRTPSSEKILL